MCLGSNGRRPESQLCFGGFINICPHPPFLPSLHALNREISLCTVQLTTSVSLEHLDFAPDPSGKWRALKWREGVKPSRRSRADNRPAQTNRRPPSAPGLNGRWRALLPGRRSLGQGHQGPHNILEIVFTNFVLFSIFSKKVSYETQMSTKSCGK